MQINIITRFMTRPLSLCPASFRFEFMFRSIKPSKIEEDEEKEEEEEEDDGDKNKEHRGEGL